MSRCEVRGANFRGSVFPEILFQACFIVFRVAGSVSSELSRHQIEDRVTFSGNDRVIEIRLWSERNIGSIEALRRYGRSF